MTDWFPAKFIEDLLLPSGLDYSAETIASALFQNGIYVTETAATRYIISGGTLTALIFESNGWTHFDPADTELFDSAYNLLSPSSANLISGRWVLSTEPTLPVYIQGTSFDVYGAAADLLEARASEISEEIESFSVFNGSFNWGVGAMGKWGGPLRLAREYRKMMRIASGQRQRLDTY